MKTYIRQINKPDLQLVDNYEVPIMENGICAFNKSGDVMKGHIQKIKRYDWRLSRSEWWSAIIEIEIKEISTGKISVIRNPNSICMLIVG